jgi:hypothetical protein
MDLLEKINVFGIFLKENYTFDERFRWMILYKKIKDGSFDFAKIFLRMATIRNDSIVENSIPHPILVNFTNFSSGIVSDEGKVLLGDEYPEILFIKLDDGDDMTKEELTNFSFLIRQFLDTIIGPKCISYEYINVITKKDRNFTDLPTVPYK